MLTNQQLQQVQLVVFDFDGVFTNNTVLVSQQGVESVQCWRSDGLGLSRLKQIGVHLYIVSTEENPVVMVRANKLKVPCVQGVADKALAIKTICHELSVNLKNTLFMGNDINDIPAFQVVGFPVAVADAYEEVDPYVLFKTKKPGGFGAVRELCDMIYHAQTKTGLNATC